MTFHTNPVPHCPWQSGTHIKRPLLHFVGFKDDRWHSAVRVWGKPDFIHRFYDHRAVGDMAPGDKVVFACPEVVRENSFDDSANW